MQSQEHEDIAELPVNISLISALDVVHSILGFQSPLEKSADAIKLKTLDKTLVSIDPHSFVIAGRNYQDKLVTTSSANTFSQEKFKSFLNLIKSKVVRLNHVGVGYYSGDIDKELAEIKESSDQTGFHTYEEHSTNPDQRWFFLGDTQDWQAPLCEIVLNKGQDGTNDDWTPHFQIDLDTSLTPEEVISLTNKFLGENFLTWKLDVPEVGTVLAMGVLGEVNGVKITLGLGTNKRGTQFHRQEILQAV